MKKKDKKEIDAAFDNSLKRARSTYNWIAGAKKALEQERENKTPVKNTEVNKTPVKNTGAGLTRKIDNVKLQFNGYYIVPNKTDEALSKILHPNEEILYRKLYRWSWGYNRNYCITSTSILLKETNIKSDKTIRQAIRQLMKKNLIERISSGSNPKGTSYLVHIPYLDEKGHLLFLDNEAVVKNTEVKNTAVDNTPVKNTHATSVKQTPVKNTEVQLNNPKIQVQNTPNDPQNNTPVKNTEVKNTHKNKHNNTNNSKTSTLSPTTLVNKFYRLLHQNKISKQKKERAIHQINELIKEGFNLEDIDFTIEWTTQNKSGIHSFGIIAETIGEALGRKKEYLETQKRKQQLQENQKKKQKKEEQERKLQQKIKQIRSNLSQEELDKIHLEAQKEINPSKKFGKDILVRIKEDEIIKKKYLYN